MQRLLASIALALLVAGVPDVVHADVVPPRALEVAEAWVARHGAPARVRTIRSWTGHGVGDQSRMEPGGYFALVFDVVDAQGRATTEEVRLVPAGRGDWRIILPDRSPASTRRAPTAPAASPPRP